MTESYPNASWNPAISECGSMIYYLYTIYHREIKYMFLMNIMCKLRNQIEVK